MKKVITILAFALGSTAAFAQQDPQFTQYMNNKLFMNPGYAGMKGAYCFSAIARQQWAGFDGSPKSGVITGDFYMPNVGPEGSGLGINLMYDKLGFENNMGYRIEYSFHVPLKIGTLGIGCELGAFSKRVGPRGNENWVATTNWQQDVVIPPQIKKTVADLGFGLWYQNRKVWFGISSTHVNGKQIDDGTALVQTNSGTVTHGLIFQMSRHYFITGGMNLFPRNTWQIKPSFLVKSDATITSLDLTVIAQHRKGFWMGASYRYKDAICPMIGFQVSKQKENTAVETTKDDLMAVSAKKSPGGTLKFGFAYDYNTSNLRNYNSGTFELFINYCIPILKGNHFDTRLFN